MDFLEFKTINLQYAEDESIDSGKIEELIVNFFKRKAIPNLESIQQFVVRCSINKPGEIFKNTSRCSYNPNPKSIGLQRCNYPEQQVFYCSMYSDTDLASSSLTCIVETAWEHIEDLTATRTYCTLSRWQCKRPLQLWVLPFSELSCEKNRDFKKIRMNMTNILDKHKGSKEMIRSLEFMSDVFCERNNKRLYYRISSSFYNALCVFEEYKNVNIDGLMYPSANTEGAGLNLVLKKELIDNKTLWCDVATMYAIQRHPNNPKHLSAMPASTESWADKNGNLNFSHIW